MSSDQSLPGREALTPPAEAFEVVNPPTEDQLAGIDEIQTRALVQDSAGVEPPITDFEQTDGALLSPPESDNRAAALSLIQSAPSRAVASELFNELTAGSQPPDSRLTFEQLQRAFQ
jgi:hypothetical protein